MKKILLISIFLTSLTFGQDLLSLMGSDAVVVPADTVPTQFTFTDETGVARSTADTSAGIVLAGFDSAYASISGAGGTYRVGALGTYISTASMVNDGDTIWVKNTSSASYLTAVNTILTVGGVSDTYTITTLAATEMVTNGEFTSNITNWTNYNSTAKYYNTDWNGVSPTDIPCLLDSATSTSNVRVAGLVTMDNTINYTVSFDYYIPTANTTLDKIQCYLVGTANQVAVAVATVGSWQTYSGSFNPTYDKTSITFRGLDAADNDANITVGDKFYIDNVSVIAE